MSHPLTESNHQEAPRLQALYQYQILDTESEAAFDELTQLAAQICQTPIAIVVLIDRERQWFKSKVGLAISETPRNVSFCNHTILQAKPLIVQDALTDARFATNPYVTGDPKIRFYAGVALTTPSGYRIGTLCVVDYVPRQLDIAQIKALQALSHQVVSQLELRRNLKALQENERRLSTLMGNLPGYVYQVANDLNYTPEFISEGVFAVTGYHQAEYLVDRTITCGQEIHPDDSQPIWQQIQQAVKSRQPYECEYRIITKTGAEKWVWERGRGVYESNGELLRLEGFVTDISVRKAAKLRLHQKAQQEHLMRVVTEHIRQSLDLDEILTTTVSEVRQVLQADRVLIFRLESDGSGNVVQESVDAHWQPILGQNLFDPCFQSSYIDKYFQGRVHATHDIDDGSIQPCYAEFLKQFGVRANLVVPIIQSGCLWGLLIAHQCAHPRQWSEEEAQLLKQLADQVAIAIHQSSLYKQAQNELKERIQAEAKIRDQAMLLNVATDAIIVRDLDQHITFWNQGAERLYGWSSEEMLGKATALWCRDSAGLQEICQTVLARGEWQGELTQLTKDQKDVMVASRWTLVRHPNGQPKAFLIVNTDITQKTLLERQFLRAQRLETIGTLAGGVAHDLNNVLAPILMSVSLLEMQPDSSKRQKWLDVIDASARRGASLVKQVLTFARGIEGERSQLEIRHLTCEIKQVIEETFPKSINIFTHIPNHLSMVMGDVTQIHQILMNLCLNARDAMPNGGMLRITAENQVIDADNINLPLGAQPGSYVAITVADTGTGIAADAIDRIFDPFFTTKEMGKGTGLGLSTVMTIIKSHNGFMTVSSQIGNGTEFKVYLPALQDGETQEPVAPKVPYGAGEWILLADDEAAIREATKTMLEAHGYRVLTASNGIEAIALYSRHQDDIRLAVVNIMMPAMNGTTAIRTLQAINPYLKIVATSGLTTNDTLIEMGIKVDHFLLKPFIAQELIISLHQVLNS
ncbi:MAG: GAF domain-containing protein [Oscillatoriophycideae cyanobacterium NC_groundwater_1537_Pr4_S-0.65um_50_18]|nr:GAF domain-containing protein [Oscillatoriophycideae cyanobacterium NC_groundwater_1537_Pr4_S-0.65um_50_18]